MGVIYRARERQSKRVVALKRLLSYHGDSMNTLERFRREAKAAASLDHRNILPIYEVGESEGMPFFAMKYASGGSLLEAAAALRSDPRACVHLLAKVACAVAYAHSKGILHRDLKPGNILLDRQREPLVCDFGLAQWIDSSGDVTSSVAIFGTPGYIAPEELSGNAGASPAGDLYSLGAMLFDLLANRPPFPGENALIAGRQAVENPAPALRSITPNPDPALEAICARCLERDPKARYSSADDLAADLERWLEGERPIARRGVSPG
jgi:serine/threonine-protein kinase